MHEHGQAVRWDEDTAIKHEFLGLRLQVKRVQPFIIYRFMMI